MAYSKYHALKTTIDDIIFDSKLEANRYRELKLMLKSGAIKDLKLQVPFDLVPKHTIEGITLRATKYIADFTYIENGVYIVEDTKGFITQIYKTKRKQMLQRYGIEIREVTK